MQQKKFAALPLRQSLSRFLCLSACLSMPVAVAPTARAQDVPAAPAPEAPQALKDGEQALVLSTLGGTWTVQGEFKGRMSLGAQSLALSFDKARLVVRDKAPAGTRRQIVSVTPVLATSTAEAPFTIARRGKALAVNREVSLEQPCEVEAFTSEIVLDNTIDLSKHWLVLEIQMTRPAPDDKAGPSFVFINSDKNIFAPKP